MVYLTLQTGVSRSTLRAPHHVVSAPWSGLEICNTSMDSPRVTTKLYHSAQRTQGCTINMHVAVRV